MHRQTKWCHAKKHELLTTVFGFKCEHCGAPDRDYSESLFGKRLEFAHKIGYRISGMSRGLNARIQEVRKNPEQFLRLCTACHRKYDYENPLSDYEKQMMDSEVVPF